MPEGSDVTTGIPPGNSETLLKKSPLIQYENIFPENIPSFPSNDENTPTSQKIMEKPEKGYKFNNHLKFW